MGMYHCGQCGDVMPVKYRVTHPVLCMLASRLMARDVDILLDEIDDVLSR